MCSWCMRPRENSEGIGDADMNTNGKSAGPGGNCTGSAPAMAEDDELAAVINI